MPWAGSARFCFNRCFAMSSMTARLARPATAVLDRPSVVRGTRADLMLCLIVSDDAHRRRLFDRAAEEQGWDTIVSSNSDEAMQIAIRERLRLAIVDLQSAAPTTEAGYRRFVEWMSKKQQSLAVVCGNEDDVSGEVWARQLGVWMYLPGVDDQTDIALVCGEARGVAEKLFGSAVYSSCS
jgi:ActR/RegA family two-component response regulator